MAVADTSKPTGELDPCPFIFAKQRQGIPRPTRAERLTLPLYEYRSRVAHVLTTSTLQSALLAADP